MLEQPRNTELEPDKQPEFSSFVTLSEFIELEPELIRQGVDNGLHRLFISSKQDDLHYEGAAVRVGALNFVEENRSLFEFELLKDAASIDSRILECYRWAADVFALYPDIKAAILFGSALMGKETPNDYDFYLAHGDSGATDEVLDSLTQKIVADSRLPTTILGAPASATVVASYDDHTRLRLRFLERGPYLVIGRLPALDMNTPEGLAGGQSLKAVQVFANFAGRAFLSQSPKYNPLLRAELGGDA